MYRNFIEKGILYIRHASDRMESMRINMRRKRVAIVTGASSGFGREFVKLFEHKKEIEEIWAVARDKKKLRQLSEEYGKKVRCISMDLSSKRCIKKFGDFLKKEKVSISYLVNSAGYGKFGSYGDLDIDSSLNMIDLNVSGVVAMGLVCIPHIRRGGHIINVASQASFQPLPYFNIYSATKAFVRNYSRALNIELRDRGISVTAVCPGWMKTAFFDRAEIGAAKGVNCFIGMASPEKVAAKALKDAGRGRDISVYGGYVKLEHLLAKLFPQRIVMKAWLWLQRDE